MTEPRMRQRQKGQQFSNPELESFLFSHGSPLPTPPATLLCLDTIITDFIIETCHEAAARATLAGRQKIKLDDFKFMLRKDEEKLGRVEELMALDKRLKDERRIFSEEVVAKREEKGEKGGRGRGRRKRKRGEEGEEGEDEDEEEDGEKE